MFLVDQIHYTNITMSKELKNMSCNARPSSLSQSCAAPAPHMSRDRFWSNSVNNTLFMPIGFVLHQNYPALTGPFLRDPYRPSLIPRLCLARHKDFPSHQTRLTPSNPVPSNTSFLSDSLTIFPELSVLRPTLPNVANPVHISSVR